MKEMVIKLVSSENFHKVSKSLTEIVFQGVKIVFIYSFVNKFHFTI